jgi:hypothetical protein
VGETVFLVSTIRALPNLLKEEGKGRWEGGLWFTLLRDGQKWVERGWDIPDALAFFEGRVGPTEISSPEPS